jgi:hypothetical protein
MLWSLDLMRVLADEAQPTIESERRVISLEYSTPVPQASRRLSRVGLVLIVLLYAVASIPSGLLLALYVNFTATALYLGRFPAYSKPDPKDLPAFVTSGEFLALPGMVMVPAFVAFVAWRLGRRRPEFMLLAPIALALGAWIMMVADPFGAMNWWLD